MNWLRELEAAWPEGCGFAFDYDGNIQMSPDGTAGMTSFSCAGRCGDPSCKGVWHINKEVVWKGDVLDQLRRGFGSRRPDGLLWSDVWALRAKAKVPTLGRTAFYSRAVADFIRYIDEQHAMLFARQTTTLRPGVRDLMSLVLRRKGSVPIISNGIDRWMLPLITERLSDILGESPEVYCNQLIGSPDTGYTVRGHNDSPDGIRKEEIVRANPSIMAYSGDTGANDRLAALEILRRRGFVVCIGDKAPGSLWNALQEEDVDSDQILFAGETFTEVPRLIIESGVLSRLPSQFT